MTAILIAMVSALIGFVFFFFGWANLLTDRLSKFRKIELTEDEKKRKKRKGWAFVSFGTVIALSGFAFAWFQALPGPSFSDTWSAMESHVQIYEPEIDFNGMSVSWSFDPGPDGVDHYEVTLKTTIGRRNYLVHFDPLTKEINTIERKP